MSTEWGSTVICCNRFLRTLTSLLICLTLRSDPKRKLHLQNRNAQFDFPLLLHLEVRWRLQCADWGPTSLCIQQVKPINWFAWFLSSHIVQNITEEECSWGGCYLLRQSGKTSPFILQPAVLLNLIQVNIAISSQSQNHIFSLTLGY